MLWWLAQWVLNVGTDYSLLYFIRTDTTQQHLHSIFYIRRNPTLFLFLSLPEDSFSFFIAFILRRRRYVVFRWNFYSPKNRCQWNFSPSYLILPRMFMESLIDIHERNYQISFPKPLFETSLSERMYISAANTGVWDFQTRDVTTLLVSRRNRMATRSDFIQVLEYPFLDHAVHTPVYLERK